VLLTPEGVPLIADFGLARRIDAGHEGSGEISGTPNYMAPEQALLESHPLSASTDIYGLGAILYELLVGRPPFQGADAQAVLDRVATEAPVAPREVRPGLPRDLEAICLKCLEKAPGDRYASARDLADDLGRFVEGRAVGAHPLNAAQRFVRWVKREPRLAAAIAGAALALGLGIAATTWQWSQAVAQDSNARFLEITMLMPEAHYFQREAFAEQLETRLSEERRGQLLAEYAASTDPSKWLVAGLVGVALPLPDSARAQEQLRRAAAARPGDALPLLAAIDFCSPYTGTGQCAVPDAAARLARLQPDNLIAWLSLIDPPELDGNGQGHRKWRLQNEPAFRAQVREWIGKAASATHWDDGLARMAKMRAEAYGAAYVHLPERVLQNDVGFGLLWSAPRRVQRTVWNVDYDGIWTGSWMGGTLVLETACWPSGKAPDDPGLRADCLRIARVLFERSSRQDATLVGARMLLQHEDDATARADVQARVRRYLWVREQAPWTRDRKPLESGTLYLADWERFGEVEAMRRELERLGIPHEPLAGWKHHGWWNSLFRESPATPPVPQAPAR
jgi:hypothetical protein